jgi:hypothetical protein
MGDPPLLSNIAPWCAHAAVACLAQPPKTRGLPLTPAQCARDNSRHPPPQAEGPKAGAAMCCRRPAQATVCCCCLLPPWWHPHLPAWQQPSNGLPLPWHAQPSHNCDLPGPMEILARPSPPHPPAAARHADCAWLLLLMQGSWQLAHTCTASACAVHTPCGTPVPGTIHPAQCTQEGSTYGGCSPALSAPMQPQQSGHVCNHGTAAVAGCVLHVVSLPAGGE